MNETIFIGNRLQLKIDKLHTVSKKCIMLLHPKDDIFPSKERIEAVLKMNREVVEKYKELLLTKRVCTVFDKINKGAQFLNKRVRFLIKSASISCHKTNMTWL